MAAREDVLPDEVRGRAVGLVALVRLRNGLRRTGRVSDASPEPHPDIVPEQGSPYTVLMNAILPHPVADDVQRHDHFLHLTC